MPGSVREVNNAEEEGVKFIWLSNPKKFIGSEKVASVLVEKMEFIGIDSSGRKKSQPIKNSNFEIKSDMIIKALGFGPENLPKLFNNANLAVSNWGTVKVNLKSMETNIPGIFAAGDIVRGASLVVWAIKDGRDAAISIQKYLENKKISKIKVA
jgi:glutamate synthase (NADPH/NADH) small chain